jgi:succinate dehydrogenase / fumarate reductase cytochrome b subunit
LSLFTNQWFYERGFTLASLALTIRETLRYRGAIGQWSWVLHRLTGLGVVFFLVIHVIDTSWAVFFPALYEKAILIYQTPLFTLGEFALVFAVVYHALNGIRIAVFDFKPEWWKHQEKAAQAVFAGTVLILVPMFIGMAYHAIQHYSHDPFILPLSEVLAEQIPFLAGIVVAAIAAIILAFGYNVVMGATEPVGPAKAQGSALEKFWWSFMRASGLLIVPLVFGHLAAMHVVQGVFDLTAAQFPVVGVRPSTEEPFTLEQTAALLADDSTRVENLLNGWNDSGTATEFVAERWSAMLGPVFIWRAYDIALLALVTIHGFNGLRYVLTDYTQGNAVLRRAAGYLCVIGALALLIVGGAALLSAVPQDAIKMASEATRAIMMAHGGG